MTEPIHCPFCGCKEIDLKYYLGGGYFYMCTNMDCLAERPFDLGKSGALEKWNNQVAYRKIAILTEALDDIMGCLSLNCCQATAEKALELTVERRKKG